MAEAAIALVATIGADAELCDLLLVRAAGSDWNERVAAARVLGESFGGEPAVREVLVALARDDDDVQVRREALRVLNERLASHDEVRQLLVDRVRDRDWSVRKDAVRGLCEHYGTDPQIRALLVELARDDPDPNFRRVAGQALSGLPGAAPAHFPDIDPT
jgi:HEAT repeat protein